MDYLNPAKKLAHKKRLYLGYALFAVAIGFATLILGFLANGFYVDRSGDFIQNGLVFVNSQPGDADVYLNNEKQQNTTDARIVIPAGSYTIGLQKDGYRDWSRSLRLEGGSLRRLTYARLVPEELETTDSINLRSQPIDVSQSIDKRWLMLSHQDSPLSLTVIDTERSPLLATRIDLPESIVTDISEPGVLEFVEWSSDNSTVLANYTVGKKVEYLLINRADPELSTNVTTQLAAPGYTISLLDRKKDQFFVFRNSTKLLYKATLDQGIEKEPIIDTLLLDYETFSSDWLLYVRESGDKGLVDVRFKRGDTDIQLKQLKTDDDYLLELAQLGNSPVMAISSPVEGRAVVYNDPQDYLSDNPEANIPVATTVLQVPSIRGLTISSDSSVVLGYSKTQFASHEFEVDRSYKITLSENFIDDKNEPTWIDGQHLAYSSGGVQHMIDYDGSNNYDLVSSIKNLGSFYTEDGTAMLTFNPALKAIETTPAAPLQLVMTSLLDQKER